MRGLKGRSVIVTGAAQGIGRAIASRFIAEGARVFAVDMKSDGLEMLDSGPNLSTMVADLTAVDSPVSIISGCVAAFGGVDTIVNNAGMGNAPPLDETDDAAYDRYMDVNLKATFRLSRDALQELRRSRGTIVNIASSVALSGYRRSAAYTAAKAGVIALTRNMAAEYGPDGIRVNAVAPGVTATPLTADRLKTARFKATVLGTMPLGVAAEPDDVASAVAFLASDEARMITGQVIAVDGGQTSSVFLAEEIISAWVTAQEGVQQSPE